MADTFTSHKDIASVEMWPGVCRQVLACGERAMVVKVTLEKGSEVPLHSHPHEQVGHIGAGALRFRIGDRERVVEPGDGYVVPPGVQHGAAALEDTVAIDVFSPPREEYR